MPRPAGSPNKSKQALIALLKKQYPGYEPILELAGSALEITRLAKEAKDDADLWMQCAIAHEKVAQYVTPKLKAVEVTGEDGGAMIVQVVKHGSNK